MRSVMAGYVCDEKALHAIGPAEPQPQAHELGSLPAPAPPAALSTPLKGWTACAASSLLSLSPCCFPWAEPIA